MSSICSSDQSIFARLGRFTRLDACAGSPRDDPRGAGAGAATPSPRNIHGMSTEYPRNIYGISTSQPRRRVESRARRRFRPRSSDRGGRSGSDARRRRDSVVCTKYPRRSRGVAATRRRGTPGAAEAPRPSGGARRFPIRGSPRARRAALPAGADLSTRRISAMSPRGLEASVARRVSSAAETRKPRLVLLERCAARGPALRRLLLLLLRGAPLGLGAPPPRRGAAHSCRASFASRVSGLWRDVSRARRGAGSLAAATPLCGSSAGHSLSFFCGFH